MGEVGDGSMGSPPEIEPLPMTANADGSVGVDLSDLDNPDMNISASVNFVAEYCRRKKKELRVKLWSCYFKFIVLLSQMGFSKIDKPKPTYIVLREDQSDTILHANDSHEVSDVTLMQRGTMIASSINPCRLIGSQTPGGATSAVVETPSQTDDRHFSLEFESEWVVALENILNMQPRRTLKKQIQRDRQKGVFSQSLPSTITGYFTGAEDAKHPPRLFTKLIDCCPADAKHPPRRLRVKEPGDEPDSESEATDVSTDEDVSSGESGASLESHTEIASADSHDPRTQPSRKRSATSAFDEDSLFAKIRPFVNQQIEEALLPLVSALRSREEDEHKHRQKMLALEREKLALMRQKLECTRRSNAVPASVAKFTAHFGDV